MDQHSPDSGACTGSDTELAEHDLEKVDLAEEAVEEGDTEVKLATATSTLSFSNLGKCVAVGRADSASLVQQRDSRKRRVTFFAKLSLCATDTFGF